MNLRKNSKHDISHLDFEMPEDIAREFEEDDELEREQARERLAIYDQYADGAIQARRSGRMEGLAIAFILIGVGSLAALAIWLWEHPEVHA